MEPIVVYKMISNVFAFSEFVFFLLFSLHCPRADGVVYVVSCLRQPQMQIHLLHTYAMRYVHTCVCKIHASKQAAALPPVLHVREASPQITANRGRVNIQIKNKNPKTDRLFDTL